MTKPQTVKEWVSYIYDKLTIAERTNSWVAEGLQKIEVEYERAVAERDGEMERSRELARALLSVYPGRPDDVAYDLALHPTIFRDIVE